MPRKEPQVIGGDLNPSESSRPPLPFAPPHSTTAFRAGVNAKPFGNDADTGPPRSRQSLTDSFFEA